MGSVCQGYSWRGKERSRPRSSRPEGCWQMEAESAGWVHQQILPASCGLSSIATITAPSWSSWRRPAQQKIRLSASKGNCFPGYWTILGDAEHLQHCSTYILAATGCSAHVLRAADSTLLIGELILSPAWLPGLREWPWMCVLMKQMLVATNLAVPTGCML